MTAKFEQDPEWFGSLDPGGSETLDLSLFILRLIKHDHDQRTTCRLWLHTYPNSIQGARLGVVQRACDLVLVCVFGIAGGQDSRIRSKIMYQYSSGRPVSLNPFEL